MDKLTNIICWLQPRRAEIFKVETIFTLEQLFFMDSYFKNLSKNTTMRKSMSEAFFVKKVAEPPNDASYSNFLE